MKIMPRFKSSFRVNIDENGKASLDLSARLYRSNRIMFDIYKKNIQTLVDQLEARRKSIRVFQFADSYTVDIDAPLIGSAFIYVTPN